MTAYQAEVPSNIAFVKYWGKRDAKTQWPAADSLSMTLSKACTTTICQRADRDSVSLNGQTLDASDSRAHKVLRHLDRLRQQLKSDASIAVRTNNSFPSDCGIASSASGFGALTVAAGAALCDAKSFQELSDRVGSKEDLAHWARMGSGSAGRSLFGGYVRWDAGSAPDRQRLLPIAPREHWDLADVIVLISREKKPVSSTDAHKAAWTSPLFEPRLAGLPRRLAAVQAAIRARDFDHLGDLIETEALDMHAVILSATPAVPYLTKDTGHFLAWVRKQRSCGRLPTYFTLDGGPNVHLICQRRDASIVAAAVQETFDYDVFVDHVGSGPTLNIISEDPL